MQMERTAITQKNSENVCMIRTSAIRSARVALMAISGGSISGWLLIESNTSEVLVPPNGSRPNVHW